MRVSTMAEEEDDVTTDISEAGITVSKDYFETGNKGGMVDTVTDSGLKMKVRRYKDSYEVWKYSMQLDGETNVYGKKGVFPVTFSINEDQYNEIMKLYDKKKGGALLVPTDAVKEVIMSVVPVSNEGPYYDIKEALKATKNYGDPLKH